MRLPEIVAAADWSVDGAKRSVAIARREEHCAYRIEVAPTLAGDPATLLDRLRAKAGRDGVVLVGFDFPIGLPRVYARRVGLKSFRQGLEVFGTTGVWQHFYEVTDEPSPYQPFGSQSNPKNGLSRDGLARRLGLVQDELFRRCDLKTATRQKAEALFFTRFPKAVGKAAVHGWSKVLAPAQASARLWPFDGRLEALLATPGVVVSEIYPAEAAAHMGLPLGPGKGRKGRQDDRAAAAPCLLAAAADAGIRFAPEARAAVESGCDTDDAFDAAVALVSMVLVLRGQRPADPPDDEDVRKVEGWILGQDPTAREVTQPPRASVDGQVRQREHPPYFIRRVVCGVDESTSTLDLAYPTRPGRGSMNVICGLNNTGKSFLLEQIRKVLKGKPHNSAISVEPLPHGQPRLLFLGKTWHAKDEVGVVNLDQTRSALSVPAKLGEFRRTGLMLLAGQMASHLSGVDPKSAAERLVEPSVREEIARVFAAESEIYRCRGDDPLIQRLERILQGRLYFRCAKRDPDRATWQFEFVLLYDDGTTVPFKEWSDGQRACFYVLASLECEQPEIVLFDEIENHLHPAYMSHMLEALRAFPAQTIVATHHPHLIFSQFADRVFYIDTARPGRHRHPPARFPYSKRYADPRFERRVLRLEDDFARITSAYKLFDLQDDQLLRQAGYVQSRATLALLGVLASLFDPAPAGASRGPLPDTQTGQLADRLRAVAARAGRGELALLDLGAGLGRVVAELEKLSEWQLGTRVRWWCYEPFAEARRELRRRLGTLENVSIIDDLGELQGRAVDVCLIANVLHELTPPEFARYLSDADLFVDHEHGGSIVVLELFPLLRPEGYAVPYDAGLLVDVFHDAGLAADVEPISLRASGTTAYCLLARRADPRVQVDRAQVEASVEAAWSRALRRALQAYSLKEPARRLKDHQALLSHLTTIASITSWREGTWRPRAPAGAAGGAAVPDTQPTQDRGAG